MLIEAINFSNFASVSVNNGNISVHRDNLAAEMDEIYKIIGRIVGNKPLWIGKQIPYHTNTSVSFAHEAKSPQYSYTVRLYRVQS